MEKSLFYGLFFKTIEKWNTKQSHLVLTVLNYIKNEVQNLNYS